MNWELKTKDAATKVDKKVDTVLNESVVQNETVEKDVGTSRKIYQAKNSLCLLTNSTL